MISSVTSVITSGTPERASALSGPEQIQESSSEIFGVNAFVLKIIAIITMTIDHIVFFRVFDFYIPSLEYLRIFGRFTFVIMVFLMSEGYRYTHNKYKYFVRMLLFAVLAMYPYYLLKGHPFNVLFTLAAGLLLLIIKDETVERLKSVSPHIITGIFLILAAIASWVFREASWGWPGILAIYIAGQIKDPKINAFAVPCLLFIGSIWEYGFENHINITQFAPFIWCFYGGILMTIPLLCAYNGEEGYKGKGILRYMFYAYYPLHLAVLYCIKMWC